MYVSKKRHEILYLVCTLFLMCTLYLMWVLELEMAIICRIKETYCIHTSKKTYRISSGCSGEERYKFAV